MRPIWGLWSRPGLVFTTAPASRMARDFGADPRVAVHAELVREVVVVDGVVSAADPPAADLAAYAEKYGWSPPPEQRWYAVVPRGAYAAREETFPDGATRYGFASG